MEIDVKIVLEDDDINTNEELERIAKDGYTKEDFEKFTEEKFKEDIEWCMLNGSKVTKNDVKVKIIE
jgi:hypothetical protein